MAKTKPTKALEKANNYYIVLVLITLLTVGISGFLVKTLISSISHSTKVLSAKSAANKQLDSDQAAAPQLIASYKALTPAATQILSDALPTTSDFPSFIAMLENMGGQAGVTISSIAPDTTGTTIAPTGTTDATATAAPAAETAQPYQVSISAKGSYAAMQKFLANTELSARPVRITNIQLSGNNSAMTATLSASTYYAGEAGLPFSTKVIK